MAKRMTFDVEEQQDLFPELDDTNPAHKALLKACRAFYKAKADRDTLLKENKAHVEGLHDRLLAMMHEADIKKFRFKDITAQITATREKVQVKLDPPDDEAGDAE